MDDLIEERHKVRNAIMIIENITRRLEHLGYDTEEETIDRITKRQWDEVDDYRHHIHMLRNIMRVSNISNRCANLSRNY